MIISREIHFYIEKVTHIQHERQIQCDGLVEIITVHDLGHKMLLYWKVLYNIFYVHV